METLSRQALRGSLYETAAELATSVAEEDAGHAPATRGALQALDSWIKNHPTRVGNIDRIFDEVRNAEPDSASHPRLAVISVALRTLSSAS